MFKKNKKNILRQPKIYSAPKDRDSKPFPAYIKIIILILIVLSGLGYLILYSPVFKISTIDIIGFHTDESRTYLEKFKGTNIFYIDTKTISGDLNQQNPEFQNIRVSCGIPNILRVEFAERQPVVVWNSGGKLYLMDENAVAYKQVDAIPPDLISVIDNQSMDVNPPEQIASSNFINFIKDVKTKISSMDLEIKQYEINETIFQVDAILANNVKIIFDTTRSSTDQVDAVSTVYRDHKAEISKYMDVRVEGKVYYQ